MPFDMPQDSEPASDADIESELDLALAAELQAALMPADWPIDAPNYRAASLNRMCGRVGGDFCDFMRLNSDQVAFAIGDVGSHGVRASLLVARIMGLLRCRPAECARPSAIVRLINEMLLDLGDRLGTAMNCSLFYAVLDTPTGTAFFVNAGLPLPALTDRRSGVTVRLGPQGSILGVRDVELEESCHTFVPGQRLALCSDGVIDAADHNGRPFGADRLEEVLRNYAQAPCHACAQAVLGAVDDFRQCSRQRDDETILMIDRL
jgi:sigma-B regulation protein RsbU (phosphoserine phosphatase)